jgi:hypothetical protein
MGENIDWKTQQTLGFTKPLPKESSKVEKERLARHSPFRTRKTRFDMN